MRTDFTKEWKDGKLVFCTYDEPDLRKYAERPRVRHRLRPNCKECVKQGLKGLAHNDAWCKGFCKMHAGQQGLKDPKGKNKTKVKVKKETKVKMKKEPKVTAEAAAENAAKMWKVETLNPQAELPEDWEDSEDSEASKKEDTKKEDTKKDKCFSDAVVVLPDHVMEASRAPQKKQKDRAIDKRPVLVF